jgi:uncharacterized protein
MSALHVHSVPRAQRIVEATLEVQKGAKSLVLATIDGFVVASASNIEIDASRIAAMASSIASIGAVVSEETRLGESKSVIVECVDGIAIVIDVPHPKAPMVLVAVADSTAILGQLLYHARQAAQGISMLD